MPPLAIVPSPLSASSSYSPTETHFLVPLETCHWRTSSDELSGRTTICGKQVSHHARGVCSSLRQHEHYSAEAWCAQEIGCSSDNSPVLENGRERISTQAEQKGYTTSSPFLYLEGKHAPRTGFLDGSPTRRRITDYLSRNTFNHAEGMFLHSLLVESGFDFETFEANVLMRMYGNFGALEDARFVFCRMQQPDVVSWNTLMSAYMHQECYAEVLDLFAKMQLDGALWDPVSVKIVLRSCAGLVAFSEGRLVHCLVIMDGLEGEVDIGTSLILMYGRCGAWTEANVVFDSMPKRDEFTWTTMIMVCFNQRRYWDTLQLYQLMLQEGRVPNKVILLTVLKSCANSQDLAQGKLVHKYIAESAFAHDEELANALVIMYGVCGATDVACSVFENMCAWTVASYNAMFSAYLSQGLYREAFHVLQQMLENGLKPGAAIYSKAVHACERYSALECVQELHFHVIKFGLDSDMMIGNVIVGMYCKCGNITEGRLILSQMKERDISTWNTLLATCVQCWHPCECIQIFEEMVLDGTHPNKETFSYVLPSCAYLGALESGKIIHACIVEDGFDLDAATGTSLINMYGKCGALEDAHNVFDKVLDPNIIHWTSMIAVYVHHGRAREALQLFEKMQHARVKPNSITFTNVLNACASLGALMEGQMVHVCIKDSELKADPGLANALLHMYCKCGALTDARLVFEDIVDKKTVSWNVLIAAYIQQDQFEVATQLFQRMQKETVKADEITFVNVLRACAFLEDLELGMELHSLVVERGLGSDIIFATVLITMYGACGALEESHWVFDSIEEHNIVSWTSIIAAYVQQGYGQEAIELFDQMKVEGWEPDSVTLVSVLGAYAILELSAPDDIVKACLNCNLETDVLLGNALINMYAKCSAMESAMSIFEKMHVRNITTWNTIISAYGQCGCGKEALRLLQKARDEGISPDELTWSHCLSICAALGALGQGKLIHRGIVDCGHEANVGLGNALVSMYGKCGAMEEAISVFNNMQRDVVSWNAILAVFSQHGHIEKVREHFKQMQAEGIKPDEVTFLSVLNACSHAGKVEDGREFFIWMRNNHKSELTISHYGCLIDLFGKSGHLDVAEDLICTVPIYTTVVLWMTLLGSCRNHGDVKRGERAMDYVARLDPSNAAPYVLMSNIYATHGRWDNVKMLREIMLKKGIQKQAACSVIEVDNEVHSFLPRDRLHPERNVIYRKLEILSRQLEEQGYVPDTRFTLQDVDEESKKFLLCHHSERLALAYGLIRKPCKEPLLIVKNLRMCADCHAAFKFVSIIENRRITVRDASRFHCFKEGLCLCGDYW